MHLASKTFAERLGRDRKQTDDEGINCRVTVLMHVIYSVMHAECDADGSSMCCETHYSFADLMAVRTCVNTLSLAEHACCQSAQQYELADSLMIHC